MAPSLGLGGLKLEEGRAGASFRVAAGSQQSLNQARLSLAPAQAIDSVEMDRQVVLGKAPDIREGFA
jgi:hypothetical protein